MLFQRAAIRFLFFLAPGEKLGLGINRINLIDFSLSLCMRVCDRKHAYILPKTPTLEFSYFLNFKVSYPEAEENGIAPLLK